MSATFVTMMGIGFRIVLSSKTRQGKAKASEANIAQKGSKDGKPQCEGKDFGLYLFHQVFANFDASNWFIDFDAT